MSPFTRTPGKVSAVCMICTTRDPIPALAGHYPNSLSTQCRKKGSKNLYCLLGP